MPDTLKEMKARLASHEATLKKMKAEARSINSLGGTTVVKLEQYRMAPIEYVIDRFRAKIQERERLLSTVNMNDVINYYDGLFQKVSVTLEKIHHAYLEWQEHIYNVGTYYDRSVTIFNKTVKAQDKYKADLANIAASIISIAGAGTFAWLSDTGRLAKLLANINLSKQANIIEDITQASIDKFVSYTVPKLANGIKASIPGPLEFQNQISLKALRSYKTIYLEVLRSHEAITICRDAVVDLQTKKTGNAKEQYEKYIAFADGIGEIRSKAEKWTEKLPPMVDAQAMTDDFERYCWSQWIPRLKSEGTARIPSVDEFGVRDPNGGTYKTESFDTWFCSELKDRLYALIDMSDIGVGEDGLWWVSTADVKKLITWANNFKLTQKF